MLKNPDALRVFKMCLVVRKKRRRFIYYRFRVNIDELKLRLNGSVTVQLRSIEEKNEESANLTDWAMSKDPDSYSFSSLRHWDKIGVPRTDRSNALQELRQCILAFAKAGYILHDKLELSWQSNDDSDFIELLKIGGSHLRNLIGWLEHGNVLLGKLYHPGSDI